MRIGAQIPKEKREYFVHECMKILAKIKRGNKFPLRGNKVGAQIRSREKQNKRGNKSKDLLVLSWTCTSLKEKGNWLMNM